MTFNEQLQEFQKQLNCTQSEIAEACGLSPAVISRYLSGERTPADNSPQLDALVLGLAKLAASRGRYELDKETIMSAFRSIFSPYDTLGLSEKVDTLITLLDIHVVDLARELTYDASYISRIRNGKRVPANKRKFIELFCKYIVENYTRMEHYEKIASLIKCVPRELAENPANYLQLLLNYFSETQSKNNRSTDGFLHKLDEFNLEDYIKSIHFDTLKVPTAPFQFPTSKDYYGIEQMRIGELDFLKSTVLSTCREPLYMYSGMPMEDMAEDVEFGKKWMLGLAMVLKKGIPINIIHNLDRPFIELMLGLESWIPLYMTGLVNPFYLENNSNFLYNHLNYFSGSTALAGECIDKFHSHGKYHLTRNKKELAYYRQCTKDLFTKALPLMTIYQENNSADYTRHLQAEEELSCDYHNILPVLPVYTIPDDVLNSILIHNSVSQEEQRKIQNYVTRQRELFCKHTSANRIVDEIPLFTEDDFSSHSVQLIFPDLFIQTELSYDYTEYRKHLDATKQAAAIRPNYELIINNKPEFANIIIHTVSGHYVTISKAKHPMIHFVIHHPILRNAIENIVAIVNE